MMLFALAVLVAFAIYVMTPGERGRLLRGALSYVQKAQHTAVRVHSAPDPFGDALQERTPWTIVTPALVALSVLVFVRMLFGGALSDPETLVRWGGNFGPRTTNGEWWRLVTAMFVHSGVLHLVACISGLLSVGLMLERLVGHFAFATVYFAAGIFASLASLSSDPMGVSVGASGAVFGLYGLLLASSIWGLLRRSPLTISLVALKKLAPGAAVFLLYNAATGGLGSAAALNGFVMGFICGLGLTYAIGERTPPPLHVAGALAATLVVAIASAVPLRGFTDVKPEIERVVAVEQRTASTYETRVAQFRLGATTAKALAEVIDQKILPELRAVRARLNALDRVPPDHKQLIADAGEYLRLRDESWRMRSEGLQKGNMPMLQKADRTERASLDVLERIRISDEK